MNEHRVLFIYFLMNEELAGAPKSVGLLDGDKSHGNP